MKLKDILEQPAGFVAPSIRVKIGKAWERKAGNGQNGPWSLQGVSVSDEDGTLGRLTVKNMDPFPTDRAGQWVTIRSTNGKHGLNGLKVNHDQRDDKTYSEIMVSGAATWEWEVDAQQSSGQPAGNRAPAPAPSSQGKNAAELDASWCQHVVETAKLAKIAAEQAGITDHAATSNVFACLIIGSKERGVWLSKEGGKPPVKAAPPPPQPPQATQGVPGAVQDDDIPF